MAIDFKSAMARASEARQAHERELTTAMMRQIRADTQRATLEAEKAYAAHVASVVLREGSIDGECAEVTPMPRLPQPE